jgi:hypothetical protein
VPVEELDELGLELEELELEELELGEELELFDCTPEGALALLMLPLELD